MVHHNIISSVKLTIELVEQRAVLVEDDRGGDGGVGARRRPGGGEGLAAADGGFVAVG